MLQLVVELIAAFMVYTSMKQNYSDILELYILYIYFYFTEYLMVNELHNNKWR